MHGLQFELHVWKHADDMHDNSIAFQPVFLDEYK